MATKNNDQKLSRDDIISSVAHLIAEQGLETLTMRNIARHVGCSVGTLPHYFDGKDDIVVAALNWSTERIFGRLSNMPPSETHLENLYPVIRLSMPIDDVSDVEWRVRLCLWDYAATNDEMRNSVTTIGDAALEILENLLVYLQGSNEIRADINVANTALSLYQMCIGAGFNMLHTPMDGRENQLQPLYDYIESIRA